MGSADQALRYQTQSRYFGSAIGFMGRSCPRREDIAPMPRRRSGGRCYMVARFGAPSRRQRVCWLVRVLFFASLSWASCRTSMASRLPTLAGRGIRHFFTAINVANRRSQAYATRGMRFHRVGRFSRFTFFHGQLVDVFIHPSMPRTPYQLGIRCSTSSTPDADCSVIRSSHEGFVYANVPSESCGGRR